MTRLAVAELERRLAAALARRGLAAPAETAWAASWLCACAYPGLTILTEALADEVRAHPLSRDGLGLDLGHVSCVFLAPAITEDVRNHGRVFLRNVRHGLFLLPFSVRDGLAIGCPVDPAFALGGERSKDPYAEKLAHAQMAGIDVDEAALSLLEAAGT
ncbi:MAG: hypothetical protein FJX63_01405 [Alphaproteobacteria bacterium]|nr:hypothetical protein [Alphaproteobacteria bacterium]